MSDRRRERIAELHREGMEPASIARALVREGFGRITRKAVEVALRLIEASEQRVADLEAAMREEAERAGAVDEARKAAEAASRPAEAPAPEKPRGPEQPARPPLPPPIPGAPPASCSESEWVAFAEQHLAAVPGEQQESEAVKLFARWRAGMTDSEREESRERHAVLIDHYFKTGLRLGLVKQRSKLDSREAMTEADAIYRDYSDPIDGFPLSIRQSGLLG